LDIRNYNVADIENFFELDGSEGYDKDELNTRSSEWMEKISKLPNVDSDFKDAFRSFLQEGRAMLIRERLQKTKKPEKASQMGGGGNPMIKGPPEELIRQADADLYPKPIVSKPDLPFVYARNSEYFGGVLNPLEKHLTKRVISVDSIFRDNYAATSCSDFVFRFPDPLKNVAALELMSLELPLGSWSDVTSAAASNYFLLSFTGMSGFADLLQGVVAIPDGNYTSTEMVDAITASLAELGGGALNIMVTIDAVSLKTVFYADPALSDPSGPHYSPEFSFEVNFLTRENSRMYENLGWKLGFRRYICMGNLVQTVVSDSTYIASLDQYIFLEVDDYNRNNQSNAIIGFTDSKTFLGDNILARISLQELALQGVSQIFKRREYFGGVRLEKLRIRLLDRFGKPLQMNSADYSLALEVKQIYS